MTSESGNKDDASGAPLCGERLRAGRRANDISVGDVAKELHLDEAKVRAMERNDFEALGAPVFAKGHLRKYAELVGVDDADIMSDYYQMTRAQGIPPVVGPPRSRRRDFDATPWIVRILIVMVAVAGLYWWFVMRPSDSAGPARPPANVPQSVGEDSTLTDALLPEDEPAEAEGDTARPAGAVVSPAAEPSTDPDSGTAPGPVADPERPVPSVAAGSRPAADDAPQVTVVLTFTADCWTEAIDAAGRRLYYDLGTAGRSLTLRGAAPIELILGDAGAVSVTVDGEPFVIPATSRRGRLARFSVGTAD